jgi:hypothetical protein
MPPYLLTHDGSCGQLEDGEALTPAERDTIWQWTHGDLAEGKRTTVAVTPPGPLETDSAWPTPTITPVAQGGALAEVDEYRCFPVETGASKDSFITGYEVAPGAAELVHHVVVFLVDPERRSEKGVTNAALMKTLDDEDGGRPGWPCYSAAGEGVSVDAVPVVWAPGQGPVVYPGIGVVQSRRQVAVIQMHYNLADPRVRGLSDSTVVRVRQADSVARQGFFVTEDRFLATIFDGTPDSLPPPRS